MAERLHLSLDRFSKFARARRIELGLPPLRNGGRGGEVYSLPVPIQLEVTVRLIMRGETGSQTRVANLIQQCKRERLTVKEKMGREPKTENRKPGTGNRKPGSNSKGKTLDPGSSPG